MEQALLLLRRLKLRHLELFLLMNSSGSLSEAARKAHMTQSGMSHWLNELETAVGARLVERGRQLHLTPAGEALRRLALRVVGDVTRTQEELSAIAQGAVAPLRIATITAGVAHLVPRAISIFQLQHPSVAVEMHEGTFSQLIDDLQNRKLDLIVRSIDERTSAPGLTQEPLFEDRIVPVVGPQHPLALGQGGTCEWAELATFPWIMPPVGTRMRERIDSVLLENAGTTVQPKVVTASPTALEVLLQDQRSVGVASNMLATHWVARGAVHRLPLSTRFGTVGAVFRDKDVHPALDALIKSLQSTAEQSVDFEKTG